MVVVVVELWVGSGGNMTSFCGTGRKRHTQTTTPNPVPLKGREERDKELDLPRALSTFWREDAQWGQQLPQGPAGADMLSPGEGGRAGGGCPAIAKFSSFGRSLPGQAPLLTHDAAAIKKPGDLQPPQKEELFVQ